MNPSWAVLDRPRVSATVHVRVDSDSPRYKRTQPQDVEEGARNHTQEKAENVEFE
jgi:hypothetical protein